MEEQKIEKKAGGPPNKIWTGLLLLVVGGVLLLRQSGYPIPAWLFTWPMILILVGLLMGIKHRFRDFSWLIMILVGSVFLTDVVWPGFHIKQYTLPIILIAVGLIFMFSPRRQCDTRRRNRIREWRRFRRQQYSMQPPDENKSSAITAYYEGQPTEEAVLDITSIFAGINKKILSKQFRGGEVVCVFGGAEINLTNADFTSPIVIDVVNVFGGTKLIVPANWEIRSEATAIFGGIDDKRNQGANMVAEKTIILKGTIMFGGIEINSF